jgi:hypothetical protein
LVFASWKTIKKDLWQIDHIFPLKAFIDYDIRDLKVINAIDNLQPLLRIENIRKNAKYDPIAFENFISKI